MYERFSQYLRVKAVSQRKLSEISCVSASTISRFCSGNPVMCDKLLKMLQVCDDLSLEWLFFGTGDMFRSRDNFTLNFGSFAGAEVASGEGVLVKQSNGVNVGRGGVGALEELILEKDRIIEQRDRVISQRDASIERLHELLLRAGGAI